MSTKIGFMRSPLFYVGDKYKLLPQISKHYPKEIQRFIEVFAGGGSIFLNAPCSEVFVNDIDLHLVEIHRYLMSFNGDFEALIYELRGHIESFGLTDSSVDFQVPTDLKKEFPKTYLARMNSKPYRDMKDAFNEMIVKDYGLLFLLLIYGFNRMLRFNRSGKFNLPVGNVDFNKNVLKALSQYVKETKHKKVNLYNLDYEEFISVIQPTQNDFLYLDPPYLITGSEYNKIWSKENEQTLYSLVDSLHQQGVKFMLSNVINYKGETNSILEKWSSKYKVIDVKSNYINYFNNSQKKIHEVLVINYD